MILKLLKQFLAYESGSALLLFFMTLFSMVWANSPYFSFHQQVTSSLHFFVNEGLMAVFFLLVGVELKRGFFNGELTRFSDVILPLFAAVGGMLAPALIYLAFNTHSSVTSRGWATPVATDIAFALGVLSLFSSRVPNSLKLFLLLLAVFDDVGAILIIAFFYAGTLHYFYLLLSFVLFLGLFFLNRFNIQTLFAYLTLGVFLWFSLLHAGIHPTVAGVLTGLSIPDGTRSPLTRLEEALNPWVAYGIMPFFALMNAGFSISRLSFSVLTDSVMLGIACGLFFGKQIGVFLTSWCVVKLNWSRLPLRATWQSLYGISLLCGIGFTMSLFLGTLAFQNVGEIFLSEVRLGVLLGSLFSGIAGAIILFFTLPTKSKWMNHDD